MYKKYFVIIHTVLYLASLIAHGQSVTSIDPTSLKSSLQLRRSGEETAGRSISGTYNSINPEEYIIDSGDEFYIKVDVPGPELKTYYSKVTSDGYLVIPEATGCYLRGLRLAEAKDKIKNNLKKTIPDAQVEVYLEKIHPINVTITGALQKVKELNLNSASRLYDLMSAVLISYQSDSLLNLKLAQASLRNISINRKNEKLSCDVLKYRLLGDAKQNPYLQDNDLIYIPYHDTASYTITVSGAVSQPLKFEFKAGDNLQTALDFAGGIASAADSTRIEIYRFRERSDAFDIINCRLPDEKNFLLQPDDRVFVRRKAQFHTEKYVFLEGEVLFPGIYPIAEGETKLSEIAKQAGGFSKNASLMHSRIYRDLNVPGGSELYKLIKALPFSMSLEWIEANFWRSAAKENLSIVACDFNKLFKENDHSQDVVLKHQDFIVISPQKVFVYVTGAVINPGTILYHEGWKYSDYVKAAGGYKERARKSRIKIIKHNTETWLDAKETVMVEPGDRIFVPQNEQKEPWEIFMQSLTITTQITTVILVLISFK